MSVHICAECDEVLTPGLAYFSTPIGERGSPYVHVIAPDDGHEPHPIATTQRYRSCCCCSTRSLKRFCRACADEHGQKMPPMSDGLAQCAQLDRVSARHDARVAAAIRASKHELTFDERQRVTDRAGLFE